MDTDFIKIPLSVCLSRQNAKMAESDTVFAQSGGFSLLRAHPEEMHYAWPLHLDFLARQVVLPRIMRGERNAKR